MAGRLTNKQIDEQIANDREGHIRFLQNALMEFGVDLDHCNTKLANL